MDTYLNTSHVNVNQPKGSRLQSTKKDLNTSHVNVNHDVINQFNRKAEI